MKDIRTLLMRQKVWDTNMGILRMKLVSDMTVFQC